MSTLWTPDGERPVGRSAPQPASPPPAPAPAGTAEPTEEELAAHMEQLRAQLAAAPAASVVANHAFGLFELAALHLSLQPPQLDEARVAIDACAALVEGMAGRLGEAEPQLVEGLGQLRMAFVQIQSATNAPGAAATPPGGSAGAGG